MSTPPDPPIPPITPVWAPALSDVAALLHARTKDASGAELGVFSAETRPTDLEVEPLIILACADVASHVGYDLPAQIQDQARNLATIYTALQVEESFYPEQVASGRSQWTQLWERYQFGIDELEEAASSYATDGLAAGQGSLATVSPTLAAQLGWPWWGTETLSPGVGSLSEAPTTHTPRLVRRRSRGGR